MDKMEVIRESVIEGLAARFKDAEWANFVTFDQIVDVMFESLGLAKPVYTLELKSLGRKGNPEKVSGFWEIYAVCGSKQVPVPFATKVSKVLFTFFMLHPEKEFSLAGLQKYHEEFKRIALALYTDSSVPHTLQTQLWAEDIAQRLSSRHGLGDEGSNDERSVAFSKAKKAIQTVVGGTGGNYVIQVTKGSKKRVLSLSPQLISVPDSFRDEVIDWQGGFAA